MSDLPVKIVFRLCTRDKKVLNFYKKVDMDINCDVLGSYWDEVSLVHLFFDSYIEILIHCFNHVVLLLDMLGYGSLSA